jgi:succinyl-CoA synthetase beta subunit
VINFRGIPRHAGHRLWPPPAISTFRFIVVRMEGTNVELGRQIRSGFNFTVGQTLDAARKV